MYPLQGFSSLFEILLYYFTSTHTLIHITLSAKKEAAALSFVVVTGTKRAVAARPRDCTLCRECVRGEEWAERVELTRVKDPLHL